MRQLPRFVITIPDDGYRSQAVRPIGGTGFSGGTPGRFIVGPTIP